MSCPCWFSIAAAVVLLPSVAAAQTKPPLRSATPPKTATIVKFEALNDGGGPLRILYSDGAVVEIPKERGRFGVDRETFPQESFSKIQVADDRQHIGWVAEYNDIRLCAQTYACSMEVVVFRAGRKPQYFSEGVGTVWDWRFSADGRQVVLHCGFSHGDEKGYYLLYDSDGGKARETFTPGKGAAPEWVRALQSREKER